MVFNDILWRSKEELIDSVKNFCQELPDDKFTKIERRWLLKNRVPIAAPEENATIFEQIAYERNHPKVFNWAGKLDDRISLKAWLSVNPDISITWSYNSRDWRNAEYICYKKKFEDASRMVQPVFALQTPYKNVDRIIQMISEDPKVHACNGLIAIYTERRCMIYEQNGITCCYTVEKADFGNQLWMSVEFPSKEAAEAFTVRPEYARFIDQEITNDPERDMKAYWCHTRLHTNLK